MPSLDALAAREGERIRVLAISQDMDGRQKVTDFFAEHAISPGSNPISTRDMDIMIALGVETLPTTILYDSEGMRGVADDRHVRMGRRTRGAAADRGGSAGQPGALA